MEPLPAWLAAAVDAAALSTVYNADDWTEASLAARAPKPAPESPEPPLIH